jgi:hypothetical protein
LKRWRRGEFDDAEAILHDVSASAAEQPGVLHLFGLIQFTSTIPSVYDTLYGSADARKFS